MTSLSWLILVIIFVIIEFFSSTLTVIWFALGSIFAMVTSNFTTSESLQFTVFIIVSLLSIIFIKPISEKYLLRDHVPTNADRIIGQTGIVNINETAGIFEIKVDGKIWTAIHIDKERPLENGEEVKIIEIRGVKLIVDNVYEKV